jgi:hypothetical protein
MTMVFDVCLGSLSPMMGGVECMGVGHMSMMGRFFMVPCCMMLGRFTVVFGGVVMMLGCFTVVFGRFL